MLRKRLQGIFDPIVAITVVLVVAALIALVLAIGTGSAAAYGGGISVDGTSGKPGKAKLRKNGKAIPPANAPRRIKRAIRAGNRIRHKPYKWGGGHRRWRDRGYDCSGAVSFVLHGGRMLHRPRASGGFMHWRKRGKGKWVTVYANGGHAYMVIAGLRFDTSGTGGKGPRWHKDMRSRRGFKARHFSRRF